MPLTPAERQRNYRERIKANKPEIWEERKKKEAEDKRKKYLKISQLSETEKVKRRKQWRELKQKKSDRRQINTKKENRRTYKKTHYRLTKENNNLKKNIETLKKHVCALKKKVYRYKLLLNCQHNDNEPEKENINQTSCSTLPDSPLSKTESFIQNLNSITTPDKNKVRRVLLEKNVLVDSLEKTYKTSTCNAERNVLKNVVNSPLVRKYKLQARLNSYVGLKGALRISERVHNKKQKDLAKTITEFYLQDDVSRASAGKKETKTLKKEKVQKRYLLANLTDIYKKFKQETGINVSYTTFVRYKPFYIVRPNISDRDTCICKKHANIEFKFIALKKLQILNGYDKLNDFVESLVCDVKSQNCMYSKCAVCKRNCISYDFSTTDIDANVSWLEWSAVDVIYKKDEVTKVCKRMTKQIKTTMLRNLIKKFEIDLQQYKIHLYNIGHQYKMYKYVKDNLKTNEVIIHCDFSENYTCKMHQEIQAVHFGASQHQISLHTSVLYRKGKKPQCFCTLSNSTDHSPEAIWAHLNPILMHIIREYLDIDTIHVFSDGPVTQYRQKKNFFLFNAILKDFCFTGTWNFFEASHGKGAADGVGGIIKRLLDGKVSHGADVFDAESAYMLLKDVTNVKLYLVNEENIKYIKEKFKQYLPSLTPVQKTMEIHQVQTINDDSHAIFSRILSCFCSNTYNKGFCNCYSLTKHNLLKETVTKKRTKRILSYSSSDDDLLPIKRSALKSTVSENKTITILSNVRVNYDDKQIRGLLQGSKAYNISSCDIQNDFKDLMTISNTDRESNIDEPSTSNSDGNMLPPQKTKHNNFFLHLSDTDDESI